MQQRLQLIKRQNHRGGNLWHVLAAQSACETARELPGQAHRLMEVYRDGGRMVGVKNGGVLGSKDVCGKCLAGL